MKIMYHFRRVIFIFCRVILIFSGAKSTMKAVTAEEKNDAKQLIKKELIELKRNELESAELTHAFITKELYWKYDTICRENNYISAPTWGAWLEKYRDTCTRQFKKFQDNNKERGMLCAARVARKHSVVSQR